ncbi:hypothetical protein DIPPA_00974 [Diplonema papillatum]|nr:hypothetical protein DIPPA_24184 [Diplonema papillatum]KAJ9437839.1 hypothetical protein DIPPA_00974 [Diplonema papillatum]
MLMGTRGGGPGGGSMFVLPAGGGRAFGGVLKPGGACAAASGGVWSGIWISHVSAACAETFTLGGGGGDVAPLDRPPPPPPPPVAFTFAFTGSDDLGSIVVFFIGMAERACIVTTPPPPLDTPQGRRRMRIRRTLRQSNPHALNPGSA